MKSVVWTRYGGPEVLQVQEVPKPVPRVGEVLIRIHAATVTAGDCEIRRFQFPPMFWLPLRLMFGLTRPRKPILGQELAGLVEAVGSGVTQFKPGDAVFAATLMQYGAYAEWVCLPQSMVMHKPANLDLAEAATIPTGGINALHFLRKAEIQAGQKLLLNGAGGSIGTYALQIAKAWGAHVTCVDRGEKLQMLTALGADQVVDYAQEDFTQRGETYDALIDIVGKSPFSRSLRCLKGHGRYVLGNLTFLGMLRGLWTSWTTRKKVLFQLASYQAEAYATLQQLIEAGQLRVVVDRRFTLDQIVEAHRYVESGQKQGNVLIRMEPGNSA